MHQQLEGSRSLKERREWEGNILTIKGTFLEKVAEWSLDEEGPEMPSQAESGLDGAWRPQLTLSQRATQMPHISQKDSETVQPAIIL